PLARPGPVRGARASAVAPPGEQPSRPGPAPGALRAARLERGPRGAPAGAAARWEAAPTSGHGGVGARRLPVSVRVVACRSGPSHGDRPRAAGAGAPGRARRGAELPGRPVGAVEDAVAVSE